MAGAFAAAPSREYQIKAVFLYNFTQFVDWPPTAFAEDGSPLIIGVLGEDPFGEVLDETVRGESIDHRPLVVRRFRQVEDIDQCHVLYIAQSESSRLAAILRQLAHRSILTVSDVPGFARSGGMIRFITADNRVRLRIDQVAARAAGLTISSKLLRPAEIVTPTEVRP
ncbi:MAG TPA: YfiR family protein [Opitutus sp.]|nr:YfiR family protein [Opitutus sp.]